MRQKLFTLSLTLIMFFGFSQDIDDWEDYIYQSTNISTDSTRIKANVLAEEHRVKPDLDVYYYSIRSGKLYRTRGDYSGRLLHGIYTEVYSDGGLCTKGLFRLGQKHGQWKEWYKNGELKQVITWSKGIKQGLMIRYAPDGSKLSEQNFKDGLPILSKSEKKAEKKALKKQKSEEKKQQKSKKEKKVKKPKAEKPKTDKKSKKKYKQDEKAD